MRWDDLRYFLAAARADGLTGAARTLQVDPATVGRRVAALEAALEQPLFAKSPRGYHLTEAGQTLLTHAEAVEARVSQGLEALGSAQEGLSGQVRIGAPDGCANFLLPQVCADIRAANPELEIQIVALPRVVNLNRREADMAIAVSPPTAGRLVVQKVTDYRLFLAATERYLAAHKQITRLDDLRDHRLVGYVPDMIFDKELDYLSELGTERVALASNSVAVQFQWIRQGAGIGVVHGFAMAAAPELRRVLPQTVSLVRTFYVVRHKDDQRLDRMNRIASLLVDGLRREVARLEAKIAPET